MGLNITSREARALTEQSEYMFKSVEKWIKQAATHNQNSVFISTNDFDIFQEKALIQELYDKGFSITLCCDDIDGDMQEVEYDSKIDLMLYLSKECTIVIKW